MKLHFNKEKFLDGLQQVQSVVGARSTVPVLSNALITVQKNGVFLMATDLDLAVRCPVEAQVLEEGATTLPAKRLFTIVRELAFSEVSMEVNDKNVATIESGGSHFKIHGLPETEFPRLPKLADAKSFTIEQKILRDALKKTAYAMSMDDGRFVLNAILLTIKEDKLTSVATDGRRLALSEYDLDLPKGTQGELLLPSKTVAEVQKLIKDKGMVTISFTENQVCFDMEGTQLYSKLVDGTYPNYRQVIPSETKERISLEREVFSQALHRASLLANEKNPIVRFEFTKNNLCITAHAPDVGESRERLAINYKGADISIGFNPHYVLDVMQNLENDEVFLELSDEMSPGVFKINAPFLYVIMPMRINTP
ncbi:MAG: DNA polymerase III subunit beta [Verrucomicrobiae bacterium]|nr:DNA polymerase III subunit beta [Verrucomicrobiae bacterium]